ncbi:hypothetical protein [Streptosporangium minutum]|uniref:hypothetical protein n=1 Tax=Streptosporangium minutum TaxID=569862 RepID=UPI0010560831|nr:hypothetical protein [Streptosporangium minutum]
MTYTQKIIKSGSTRSAAGAASPTGDGNPTVINTGNGKADFCASRDNSTIGPTVSIPHRRFKISILAGSMEWHGV